MPKLMTKNVIKYLKRNIIEYIIRISHTLAAVDTNIHTQLSAEYDPIEPGLI